MYDASTQVPEDYNSDYICTTNNEYEESKDGIQYGGGLIMDKRE